MPNTLQQFITGMQGMGNIRAQQQQEQMRQAEFDRFTNIQNLRSMAQGAMEAKGITDPVKQDAYLRARISNIKARGGDPRDTIEALQTPFEKRGQIYDNVIHIAERMGAIQPQRDLMGRGGFKQAGTVTYTQDGKQYLGTGVVGPEGKLRLETAEIPGQLISRQLGETPGMRSTREVGTKAGKTKVTKQQERRDAWMTGGLEAAQSTPGLRRALTLLDEVKTGGFEGFAIKAKQLFGIEGADEGEISNILAKNFIAQLKPVFGAAMATKEIKMLERIEPTIGKSVAANRAIINNLLRMANSVAGRGRRAAKDTGDTMVTDEIDTMLRMEFTGSGAPTPTRRPTQQQQPKELTWNPSTGRFE